MYFTFKGIKSTDMGVTVLTQPPIKSPESRTWTTFIDNKDGADSHFMGYKPIEFQMEIAVEGKDNIDRVLGWLTGEGKFVRSDFPELYRNVHIIEGLELNRINEWLYRGSVTIQVTDPYWYKVDDEWEDVGDSSIHTWNGAHVYGASGTKEKAPLEVFNEDYTRNILESSTTGEWTKWSGDAIIKNVDFSGEPGVRADVGKAGSNMSARTPAKTKGMEKGKKYTLTFDIRGTVKELNYCYLMRSSGGNQYLGDIIVPTKNSNEWVTLAKTFTVERDTEGIQHGIMVGRRETTSEEGDWFELRRVSLVEGEVPPKKWYYPWEDLPSNKKMVDAWGEYYVYMNQIYPNYHRVIVKGGSSNLTVYLDWGKVGEDERVTLITDVRANTDFVYSTQHERFPIKKGEERIITTKAIPGSGSYFQSRIEKNSGEKYLDVIVRDPVIIRGGGEPENLAYETVNEIRIDKEIKVSPEGEGNVPLMVGPMGFGKYKLRYTAVMGSPIKKVRHIYRTGTTDREATYFNSDGNVVEVAEIKDYTWWRTPPDRILLYKGEGYEESKSNSGTYMDLTLENEMKVITPRSSFVENEGNTKSYPLLHLVKTNGALETEVTINDSKFLYKFPEGEDEVYINLDGLRAGVDHRHTGYSREDVRDRNLYVIRDKGFHLNPGQNIVHAKGNVNIKIRLKDRWI